MKRYSLRRVLPTDEAWLWSLKEVTMRRYVEATWGSWDERAQADYFQRSRASRSLRIIVAADAADVGALDLERRGSEFFLSSIEILPARQNQGLGSAILRDILAEARSASKPVRLQVLRVNPARLLYHRLGFVAIGETATHVLMNWIASPPLPRDGEA